KKMLPWFQEEEYTKKPVGSIPQVKQIYQFLKQVFEVGQFNPEVSARKDRCKAGFCCHLSCPAVPANLVPAGTWLTEYYRCSCSVVSSPLSTSTASSASLVSPSHNPTGNLVRRGRSSFAHRAPA